MPVFDSVLSRFGLARMNGAGRKEQPIINDENGNRPSITVIGGSALPGNSWNQLGYLQMVNAGYKLNPDVYACVSLIAGAGKQVKWFDGGMNSKALTPLEDLAKSIGSDPDRQIEAIRSDEKARARYIKASTDPRESLRLLKQAGGSAFIEWWLSYLLLAGNNYIEIEGKSSPRTPGNIANIYLLRPDRVTAWTDPINNTLTDQDAPHMTERELVDYWRVNAFGRWRRVPPADMVHSKLFNPTDDIYGMAPLTAALLRVDTQNEGAALMKRVLQRGFAPGWIEARENSSWGDTQLAKLKETMRASKIAGEELFLENATWHPMGFPPADSGVHELQVLAKRDIAAIFHVPPELIGDTASKTYSNFMEARRALYTEAVIPLLVQFKDDWNQTIGKELNSPLDFDKDSFDAISAARAEATDRVQKLWASGLITQDEGRADLEYDSVSKVTGGNGNVFYAPANFVPLTDSDSGDAKD